MSKIPSPIIHMESRARYLGGRIFFVPEEIVYSFLVYYILEKSSDLNIRANFVGTFLACYGGRPRGKFSNLRFGVTLTFKLIAGF